MFLLLSTGRMSNNFFGLYAISKYGVEAFSDALRREMYPWGIKVSIMDPGGFQTTMDDPRARERQLRQGWDNLSEELKKDYGEEYLEKSTLSFEFLKCTELVIIIILNQNYIPLTNRVRGPYFKLQPAFFCIDFWPNHEASGP